MRQVLKYRIDKLRSMFKNPEGSDMQIVCGAMSWPVHRLVLKLGSNVLGTMCDGSFKEGLEGRIELKDQNPYLVHRMLQHIYAFEYSGSKLEVEGVQEESFISEIHTHVMMYAMGDEYDLPDLKQEAWCNFENAMVLDREGALELIPIIYTTTPDSDRGLRDLVVEMGRLNLNQIIDLPEFKNAVVQSPIYITEVLPLYFHKVRAWERNW